MNVEVSISTIESSVLESAPRWWREYYLWKYGKSILRYGVGWNKLVSISWSFAKIDGRKLDGVVGENFELIKLTEDAVRISDWVVGNFSMGRYLEVVNKPRVGKSSGVLYGLLRLLLEDERFAGLGNYVVFVIAPNKRLAINLYRYLVGLWNILGRQLVEGSRVIESSGVDRRIMVIYQLSNRGDLARRVRIRLYLGGRDSCLLGKEEHFVDRDCLRCKYIDTGRVPYHSPFMDPWMLKLSGYCPFSVSRNKGYVYNSIVVTTWDSFAKYFSHLVIRHGINKVILMLDEFLELYERGRSVVREVKVGEWMPEEVKSLVEKWNSLVRYLHNNIKRYHLKWFLEYLRRFNVQGDEVQQFKNVYLFLNDNLKFVDEVRELYQRMEEVVVRLSSLKMDRKESQARLKRLVRELWSMLGWFWFVSRGGKPIDKVILRTNERGRVVGGPGGQARLVLELWKRNNISFGVIGCSVLSSRVEWMWEFILPHESLLPIRSEINPVLKVSGFSIVGSMPYHIRDRLVLYFIENLLHRSGVNVVVTDKECLLRLVKKLKLRYDVEVVGDSDRKVVDYVVVRSNGVVYIMYPHGRVSMGVDPPVMEIDGVYILGGIRRPPRWIVPVGVVDVLPFVQERSLDLYLWYRKVFRRKGFSLPLRDEFKPGVVRVYKNKLEIYDVWDYWYDAHVLRQVIGRWFLAEVKNIVYVLKYGGYVSYSGYVSWTNTFLENTDPREMEKIKRQLWREGRLKYVVRKEVVVDYPLVGKMKVTRFVPSEYAFNFVDVMFDIYRVNKNLMKRERSLYESCRLIRRSGGRIEDWGWIRKKIIEVLRYIVYADNPKRFKWLKKIYEEKGLCTVYKELLRYLNLEKYEQMIKIPARHLKDVFCLI